MNIFFIGPTCEINHTHRSHVTSSEVNDSQPVGLGHLALNEAPRTVLGIPSGSTRRFYTIFFFFFSFFRVGRHIGLFSISRHNCLFSVRRYIALFSIYRNIGLFSIGRHIGLF